MGVRTRDWWVSVPRTVEQVEAELENLRNIRASGIIEDQLGSGRTRFPDGDDLGKRIKALELELGTLQEVRPTHRLAAIRTGK